MKIKVTSFHLLSIILIQIILIDLVLLAFLFGSIHKGKKESLEESAVLVEKEQISKEEGMKPEEKKQEGRNLGKEKPEEKKSADKRAEEKKREVKNLEEGIKPEKKAGTNPNYNFYIAFTGNDQRLKYDILKEIIKKTYFTRGGKRDYKLQDSISAEPVLEGEFIATAYDLSYKCCGKYPSHPEYGITFSGRKAVKGRTIAVDPEVIPIGSRVHLEFSKPYVHLNGWYVAEDTGSKVKGKIIDVFFGESAAREMDTFGRRSVRAKIIHPGTQANNNSKIVR